MWRDQGARQSANPVRELFDAGAQHYSIKLACRGCRRERILHAAAVWWHFKRKGLSPMLRDVPGKFRCSNCGRRGPRMDLVQDEHNDNSLPLPSEAEWKREVRRRR